MLRNAGFSMVEMAVVLLILGLLIGGVTVGAGLLRQAELRAVLAEVERHSIAVEHFSQLYGALPGDITNASGTNNFFDGQTTNGDGDGMIESDDPSGTEETFAAWDQLALARYISGSYTGTSSSGDAVIATNVPASAHVAGAGYSLAWVDQPGEGAQDALSRYYSGNYLVFASDDGSSAILDGGVIKPDDAFYIDSKADNGIADSGKILGGGSTCFSGGNYTFTATTAVCYLYFNIEN